MVNTLRFVTLDVFTRTPYSGNPVAIIHVPSELRESLTTDRKQSIAREFNLSESVFLHDQTAQEQKAGDVKIDIFTPFAEVPFAGHPTIGTSNYLLRYGKDHPNLRTFQALQTKAGRMPIELISDSPNNTSSSSVRLSVAHNIHIHQNRFSDVEVLKDFPPDARKGFQIGTYPIVSSVKGMTFILARLETLQQLQELPQENIVGTKNTYKCAHLLDEGWQVGILPTYFYVDLGYSSNGARLIRSRMMGSREDPATGSAASALCGYLTLSEEGELGRKYEVVQGVEMGRESHIGVEVTLNADMETVDTLYLSGSAVKTMEGSLEIPSV